MTTVATSHELRHATKNDLSEPVRAEVVPMLNERLADAIDLQLQAKQAHWNVKGPAFIALHELFDRVVEHASGAADLLAERVVQLGGTAEGTVRIAARRSELDEYPHGIAGGSDHVAALAGALAAFGARIRQAIDAAAEHGDAVTADLLTEIVRGNDKLLWFVEAHAQAPA
jgi:starvation-inducible DNA-binding protein